MALVKMKLGETEEVRIEVGLHQSYSYFLFKFLAATEKVQTDFYTKYNQIVNQLVVDCVSALGFKFLKQNLRYFY